MLLRYAARDDHNVTTRITMIALSGVGGRWRWPVAGGSVRWPVSGGRCPVRWPSALRWPVSGGRWLVAGGRWPGARQQKRSIVPPLPLDCGQHGGWERSPSGCGWSGVTRRPVLRVPPPPPAPPSRAAYARFSCSARITVNHVSLRRPHHAHIVNGNATSYQSSEHRKQSRPPIRRRRNQGNGWGARRWAGLWRATISA